MEPRTKAIVLGAIGLFIIILAGAIFYYLSQIAKVNIGTNSISTGGTASLRLTPEPFSSPATTLTPTKEESTKLYQGNGFYLRYPANWGLLTCSNSKNFELDPTSSVDQKNVTCNYAVKPVTFLVNPPTECRGDTTITLGGNQVVKSKSVNRDGTTQYQWCLSVNGTSFSITHRVSVNGNPASSKEDFSSQVERIISTMNRSPAGS